ncbi:hypothetical protein ACIRG5_27840 [Lentzea sp. NPDC102401]|uniref:hypothetical protein n=1 Tax=Lentzea sp. NPDC102401 TaxID=3364128 RepID=UPI0038029141
MADHGDRDQLVTELLQEVLPADAAFAVLGCKDFTTLAFTLARAGRDDANKMEGLLREVAVELEPHTLEWLAAGAESPAGYLTNKVRRAHREQ